MKLFYGKSRWLILVASLMCMPAQASAVTFLIGPDDILPNAVQTDHLASGAVTNDKIATGTITQDKLAFTPGGSTYAHVVVVAKSGGDFTDPISAMNSITGASSATPYLVKVMPGVYDLGTVPLQMKAFVTLEGSGSENTTITSSVNSSFGTCGVGTVIMADNSALRNIAVKNIMTNVGDDVQAIAANDVKALIQNVSAYSISSGRNNGLCVFGPNANVTLENSNVESDGGSQSNAILLSGPILKVNNSRLVCTGNSADRNGVNTDGSGGMVTLSNSTIELASNGYLYFIWADYDIRITNSTFIAQGGYDGLTAIHVGEVSGRPAVVTVANTRIHGGRAHINTNNNSIKLVNNYDENYNPIANE